MLSDADLALKRQRLWSRSARLRQQLDQEVRQTLGPAVRSVERARQASHWVRERPVLVGGLLLVLCLWAPTPVMRLASRGWWLWRAMERLQGPTKPSA